MQYQFSAYGHQNIRAAHKTTLEFTKDKEVSLKGDCIIGVNADFDVLELKKFIKSCGNCKVKIEIKTGDGKIMDAIEAELNPDFFDEKEIVIRRSSFRSSRTLAINSDKSSFEIGNLFGNYLKTPNNRMTIKIFTTIYTGLSGFLERKS